MMKTVFRRIWLPFLSLALLIATLSPTVIAQSASPEEESTWPEFRAEALRHSDWIKQWSEDFKGATSREEQMLYWADLFARTSEHIAVLAQIEADECYSQYADLYIQTRLWTSNYAAGVFLTAVGPDIEPLSNVTAQVFLNNMQLKGLVAGVALGKVDCD